MEDKFLKVAKQAALEAGKVIQNYVGKPQQRTIKNEDPIDFVTDADIAAEKNIVKILTANFPDHNILAEEQTKVNKGSKYTWVIDPVDGSISFAQGIPYFSVSIGLLEENEPIVGVIYIVSFKKMYWAQKGQKAFLNGKVIQASQKRSLEESIGTLDFGHNVKRQYKLDLYVNKLISKIGYIYSFGSSVASSAMVAEGILDLNVNYAFPWDFVAGTVIIREAGGKVTDFEGREPDWTKERLNIVASNGLIHQRIIDLLTSNKI